MSDKEIKIKYEDEQILLVEKPCGLVSQSEKGESLLSILKEDRPNLFCIHRLDKETSGLNLFAKKKSAAAALGKQFEEGRVKKIYQCVLNKKLEKLDQKITSYIYPDGKGMWQNKESGDAKNLATSSFKFTKELKEGFFLFEVRPKTGKTHQIRLHAKLAGSPILGDSRYGGKKFERLCLHSTGLLFFHPESGQKLFFSSNISWNL